MSEDDEKKRSPKLLPPLMAVLMPVIHSYQELQRTGYYQAAFKELDLFYESLTKKPKAEVKETWEKYKLEKSKIRVTEGDFVRRSINQNNAVNNFLAKNNNRVYGCFIEALDRHGYFEEFWTPLSAKDYKGMLGESEGTEEGETE